jgi:hypothetical protein
MRIAERAEHLEDTTNLHEILFRILEGNYIKTDLRETDSRDSSVGIATGYGLDGLGVGVRVPVGSRIFSSQRRPDRLWGPPSLLHNRYGGGGVKRPGREVDHSPPPSAEVKKMWIYTSIPPHVFMT